MSSKYLFSLFLILVGIEPLYAQNVPDMTAAMPVGAASVISQPPTLSVPTGTTPSYIKTYIPRIPITNEATINTSSNPTDVQVSTEYKDGFNRTIQTVKHYATTGNKPHLVQPHDTRYLQETATFLPYPSDNTSYDDMVFARQAYYYTNQAYPGEDYTPYSIAKNLSNSQQRVIKSFAPGKSQVGQNRGITTKQVTNSAGEVKI